MPATPDIAYAIGLAPKDAIAYFESLGYKVSHSAIQAYAAARERAFTVTGVARLDMLMDIKTAQERALREGTSFAKFADDIQDAVRRRGWLRTDSGTVVEPDTGEVLAKLPPHRLSTIFRTNMQGALMAGRYKQLMEDVAVAPYWQYVAVMDERTRPSHAAMNGRVFRFDDPFWDSHYPPCDFNCRCSVTALRGRDLERDNLTAETSEGKLEETDVPVGDHEVKVTAFVDKTTRTRFVPGAGFGRRPVLVPRAARDVMPPLGQVVGEKILAADPGIGAAAVAASPTLTRALATEYVSWARPIIESRRSRNTYRVVGTMSPQTVKALQDRGSGPRDAALVLRDVELLHLARDAKARRQATITAAQVLALPELISQARAVLWDRQDPGLLYVLDVRGDAADKVVVRVNWTGALRDENGRASRAFNSVRTAGRVKVVDLKTRRYELLEGSL